MGLGVRFRVKNTLENTPEKKSLGSLSEEVNNHKKKRT